MTMPERSISERAAPLLLVSAAALTAGNFLMRPDRAVIWGLVAGLLAICAAALRNPPRRSAVAYASAALTFALAAPLAVRYGIRPDFGIRGLMAVAGLFLIVTGNALPKTLIPLSAMRGDPARVEAARRLAGWTWVLVGLAVVVAWLLAPESAARRITFVVLPCAIALVWVQCVRVRRVQPETADR
jgi:hypothetical protein